MADEGTLLNPLKANRRARLNSQFLWLVLAVVAVAPIPLAGSNPIMWPVFAAPLGLMLAFYVWRHHRRSLSLALPVSAYRQELRLWTALICYLIVQIVPIGILLNIRVPLAGSSLTLTQISVAPGMTALMLVQICAYGAMFFLAAQISTRPSRAHALLRGLVTIVAFLAIYSLVALVQWNDSILGVPKWAYSGSATGTFVNRNSFATFLSLGLSCGVALTITDYARARSQFGDGPGAFLLATPAAGAVTVMFAALVATNSRMGLFAGCCGALATIIVATRSWSSTLPKVIAASIALIVGALSIWLLYGTALVERIGETPTDLDGRAELYRQVWQLIISRPILGYGGGSFAYVFPLIHHAPLSFDLVWDRAHSTYLSLWAELGLIMGSIPIVTLAIILARLLSVTLVRATLSPNVSAGIGAIIVCAIHSIVDFSLEIQGVTYLLAALIGSALGSSYSAKASGGSS